jgi:hypothetical protein
LLPCEVVADDRSDTHGQGAKVELDWSLMDERLELLAPRAALTPEKPRKAPPREEPRETPQRREADPPREIDPEWFLTDKRLKRYQERKTWIIKLGIDPCNVFAESTSHEPRRKLMLRNWACLEIPVVPGFEHYLRGRDRSGKGTPARGKSR